MAIISSLFDVERKRKEFRLFILTFRRKASIIVLNNPISYRFRISLFSDDRQTAWQSFTVHIFVFIASRNMQSGTGVSTLASNCLQHAIVAECIAATWSVWIACNIAGYAVVVDIPAIRSIVALYRTANRIDHAYCPAWIGRQMPKPNAYAFRLFHCHAAARFQRDASISNQITLYVHLLIRGYFHGRFHAKNLQLHQRLGGLFIYL